MLNTICFGAYTAQDLKECRPFLAAYDILVVPSDVTEDDKVYRYTRTAYFRQGDTNNFSRGGDSYMALDYKVHFPKNNLDVATINQTNATTIELLA